MRAAMRVAFLGSVCAILCEAMFGVLRRFTHVNVWYISISLIIYVAVGYMIAAKAGLRTLGLAVFASSIVAVAQSTIGTILCMLIQCSGLSTFRLGPDFFPALLRCSLWATCWRHSVMSLAE
jgi:hypothetical protein